jgi:hypothetical protein
MYCHYAIQEIKALLPRNVFTWLLKLYHSYGTAAELITAYAVCRNCRNCRNFFYGYGITTYVEIN